jgi:ABC-type molybdate transport system substrate-binding protein
MVTEFAAAIMTGSKAVHAGKTLIAMLRSPEAAAVFRSKGLEPR